MSGKGKATKLDLDQLALEIKGMQYWHPLFKTLKRELTDLKYWRNHKRGDSKLGWSRSHEKDI
jgi:protein associated with RNAse G/E